MRSAPLLAAAALLAAPIAAQAVIVNPGDSTAPWLGYMNVFELPSNGGGFVFGSGWGVPDLVASFNDPMQRLTLSPNTIGDPHPFWYIGGGGPGAMGNKIMEANLYVETTDTLSGQEVTFQGLVLSNSFTSAHVASIFIRDFAPDYSSLNEVSIPLTPGAFSLTLNTLPGAGRHVQYGFQVRGVNVWFTDTAPFGNAVIATGIPSPAAMGLGILGLISTARRRRA